MGGSRKAKTRGFQKGNQHGAKAQPPQRPACAAAPAAPRTTNESAASSGEEGQQQREVRVRRAVKESPFGSPGGCGGLRKPSAPPLPSPIIHAPDKQYLVNGKALAQSLCCALCPINDDKVQEYGSWQEQLHRRLSLSTSESQREAWRADARRRAARSVWRRTTEYKKKRAAQRKRQKQARNAMRKVASTEHTYKEDEPRGPRASKGQAGSCNCGVRVKCANRACPCVAAGVPCTSSCHGGRPSVACVRCPTGSAMECDDVSAPAPEEVCDSDPECDVASVYSFVADDVEYEC